MSKGSGMEALRGNKGGNLSAIGESAQGIGELASQRPEPVPRAGLEPARPYGHQLLKLTWLPLHHLGEQTV